MIDEPALKAAAGVAVALPESGGLARDNRCKVRASWPGIIPRGRLEVWSWRGDAELARQLSERSGVGPDLRGRAPSGSHLLPLSQVILIPDDPEAFAPGAVCPVASM